MVIFIISAPLRGHHGVTLKAIEGFLSVQHDEETDTEGPDIGWKRDHRVGSWELPVLGRVLFHSTFPIKCSDCYFDPYSSVCMKSPLFSGLLSSRSEHFPVWGHGEQRDRTASACTPARVPSRQTATLLWPQNMVRVSWCTLALSLPTRTTWRSARTRPLGAGISRSRGQCSRVAPVTTPAALVVTFVYCTVWIASEGWSLWPRTLSPSFRLCTLWSRHPIRSVPRHGTRLGSVLQLLALCTFASCGVCVVVVLRRFGISNLCNLVFCVSVILCFGIL